MRIASCFVMVVLASMPAAVAAQTHAFTNARVIPIAGAPIEKGTVVVRDGKIVAVGASVAIPQGAEVHDLSGRTIMPGLVDTHSHIASPAGGDQSAPLHPDTRVLDSVNVRSTGIRRAQAGGITTANLMPGSGLLLSGQTLYLKLRQGNTVDDYLIALRDLEDVVEDYLVDRYLHDLAVAENARGRTAEDSEVVENLLGLQLLDDPDKAVGDHYEAEQSVLGRPDGER